MYLYVPDCLDSFPSHQLQPATVSRCGMIFMEPSQLGWEPLVISWINTLPKPLQGSEYRTLLLDLFHWLLPPTLRVLRKNCKVNICSFILGENWQQPHKSD